MSQRSQTFEIDAGDAADAKTRDAAEDASLIYVSNEESGIRRLSRPDGFSYVNSRGQPIRNAETLRRIRSLAAPPAYTDVWICPKSNGHIQATGRDARGREQYRYHPRWIEIRDRAKYDHILRFAAALPALRAQVRADMSKRGLPREKVVATIVDLLETTLIRVGNRDYAQKNKSYGLTTLRNRHVAVDGGELRFRFTGKSGKSWNLKLKDRRIARIVKACQELPGQRLFEFIDAQGIPRSVDSSDVNAYLREATGHEITAKDFRTWHGTVLAVSALSEFEAFDTQALAKRNVRAAIEGVAARLGNTTTICRKCYVHPQVLTSCLDGRLLKEIELTVKTGSRDRLAQFRPEEAAALALLNRRLAP